MDYILFLMSSQNISICIPRISSDVTKWEISDVFNKLNIGKILKIVTVINTNNKTQKVFVHFKYWNNNVKSNKIKNILNSGDNIKLVYDFPNYWKCYKSKY